MEETNFAVPNDDNASTGGSAPAASKAGDETARRRARTLSLAIVKAKGEQTQPERARDSWLHNAMVSMGEAVIVADQDCRIVFMNPIAERLTGWSLAEAENMDLRQVYTAIDEASGEAVQQLLLDMARGEDVMAVALDIELVDRDGNHISIEDNAAPIRDARGETAGVVVVFRDTTKQKERRTQIEEFNGRLRQAMAESNHRIKNNLQIVAALVDLYAEDDGETETEDAVKPKSARQKLRLHIQTLAQLHDFLTEEAKTSDDVTFVPADETLAKLIPLVQSTVGNHVITFSSDAVRLSTKQSAALALVVNELVSNAVKHGKGGVDVSLVREEDSVYLDVVDDGPGFPEGFDIRKSAHNGIALADALARTDLGGELMCVNREEGGACVRLRFTAT